MGYVVATSERRQFHHGSELVVLRFRILNNTNSNHSPVHIVPFEQIRYLFVPLFRSSEVIQRYSTGKFLGSIQPKSLLQIRETQDTASINPRASNPFFYSRKEQSVLEKPTLHPLKTENYFSRNRYYCGLVGYSKKNTTKDNKSIQTDATRRFAF